MGDLFDAVKMEDNPLPGIPVQPIGYGDCARLLQQGLAGTTPLPAGWGADTGFAALLAGGIGPSTTTLVKMEVRRELEVFNITNVMASIYGGVEPDRAILYGSHQDAWTYGALDPISGASVVQEISRVLGGWHKNEGWVPRRTIQACRWDAEEWAIIGSNEFVETNLELLRQRGVAYLNVDVAVSGTSNLGAELSPLLRGVFEAAARDVPNPNRTIGGSLFTLLDGQVSSPGSGSDHVGFIQLAGVPVIDAGIGSKRNVYEAVYHSNYDSMAWIQMIDPTFGFHAAMAKLYGNIILRLSEPAVLPLVPVDYAKAVDGWVNDFVAADTQRVADWSFMRGAVASFNASAARHANRVAALQQQLVVAPHAVSPYDVRAVNDINMGVERVFIANGKKETGQHFYKHVLFTPSAVNSYGSSVMPLITLGLATQNRSDANFAIGRVAQFVFRASAFVNSSSVMPPNF